MNLGDALAAQGKFDEAVACYRRSIELSPKRVLLHNRLGGALERQGKQDEATAAYGEAKRLKAEEAVAACREAVRLKPNDPLAYFNLGVVLGKKGMLDDAIAAYQEVLLRKPDILAQRIVNNLYWDFLAYPNPQTRNAKRVVELIKQVMAQNPTIAQNPNPEELAGYASLFLLAGDIETYRQQSTRVFENHGNTQQTHTAYLVARICALAPDAQIDPSKLVQLAERAAQAKPAPHHLHTLGLVHYRAGQYDKAIEQLHKSMEGNWKAQVVNWLVLAMAHQRLGHTDEAHIWFEKAARWIDNPDVPKSSNSGDRLRTLYPHDALACMVLRREAEMLLKRSTIKRRGSATSNA